MSNCWTDRMLQYRWLITMISHFAHFYIKSRYYISVCVLWISSLTTIGTLDLAAPLLEQDKPGNLYRHAKSHDMACLKSWEKLQLRRQLVRLLLSTLRVRSFISTVLHTNSKLACQLLNLRFFITMQSLKSWRRKIFTLLRYAIVGYQRLFSMNQFGGKYSNRQGCHRCRMCREGYILPLWSRRPILARFWLKNLYRFHLTFIVGLLKHPSQYIFIYIHSMIWYMYTLFTSLDYCHFCLFVIK